MLKGNERIDDLLTYQLKIIQSSDVFSFSLDAVLLARFCTVPVSGSIVDLCTGNGVIPILLTTRTKTAIPIIGVEIQQRLWDMAVRSVRLNELETRVHMELGDLRDWAQLTRNNGAYDLVTVNPPYLPVQQGEQNSNEHVAIARHEMNGTLEEIIASASRITKAGGKVAMVHRPARIVDIVTLMRRYRLEPKRIRFVHPKAGSEANMVLIEAIRDGKPEVRMLPPLIVYDANNEYCAELLEVYYGRSTELHSK